VKATGWLKGLQVTADGPGIVSHAGVALVRALAGNTGLTAGLSGALASRRLLVHDRGRVPADLACAIAGGAEVISDFRVMGDQEDLSGLVASVPTAWRTLDEIARDGRALGKITAAVNAARRRAWAAAVARHGALPGIRIAGKTLDGVTCIRLDASVVTCHSDKEGAEPNFKGSGLHPLLAYCDNTGEPLAGLLRPGSAGSNTAADHLAVPDAAVTALPPGFRRRLMVTCDGAGASHDLIARLDALAARRGCQLTCSVGWEPGARERAAIAAVPAGAWQIAVDARGQIRERRADDARGDTGCGHRRCWIEEAHVAELTSLLREGPTGDQLAGWPATMRVFARRERPHPGAQLTLFETGDGWRYSLWVTKPARHDERPAEPERLPRRRPPGPRPGRGRHPHRQGLRHRQVPLHLAGHERGLAGRRPDRRRPAGLAAPARPGRRPGPRRAQDLALPHPARRRTPDPQRPPPLPQHRRDLALGTRDRSRPETRQRPGPGTLTAHPASRRPGKEQRDPWNPRPPGPPAGPLPYPHPKIKIRYTA
jgi:Transposase DDE domain group 1